ncbi:uncharacterized protein LY89DRAFT_790686 [Mollisia scopiformis]|uniref:HMG box domain-containing protein n=1 Tax=Mollisia scopiformis TaxID=149040 RepID=A0A132B2U4_MOLSC|nr:uncharacterized protein LY89DRAFT_790686 [Mollisia scopiformis]KUJ06234.1 hypothetical protein LY89DRAFT_790686 [Mollisia scopiformis]
MSPNSASIGAAPNTIAGVPGAHQAATELMNVMFADALLPESFRKQIKAMFKRGMKVIYFADADAITWPNGEHVLRAMAKAIEVVTELRAYVHLMCEANVYRIGQVIDDEDVIAVHAGMAMGEHVPDPNGTYFRSNGCFKCFGVGPGPFPAPIPAGQPPPRPAYPVFPYLNKKGKIVKKTCKPRNPWIIYRASRHADVKNDNPTLHTSELSSIIAKEWTTMDVELKGLYVEMAYNEKMFHKQNFPDFKLKPRKSEAIQRRRAARREGFTVDADVEVWAKTT